MKSVFKSFQLILLLCGVFGADEAEVKSVMEGDPVTLIPDLNQIQTFNLIKWRFGDPVIAQTDGKEISYPSHTEIFRDRLQLDQTGSLTIKNTRTKHSGLYKLQISHNTGTAYRIFNVTIHESALDSGETEIKSMSLMEGYPVTLQTDVTLYGDELIVWRFGGKLIAKHDTEAESSPLYYDERFRVRLRLDQTGSLIITNTKNTDSGLYTAKISSNKQTLYNRFTVTVSDPGLSAGAVAGIVICVVLVCAAGAAALMYFRPWIRNLPSETRSVLVGDDVTLNPGTEIKTSDEIQWLFGPEERLVAENKKETREMNTYVKLDKTTGSLTITNITTARSGCYTVKIRRCLIQTLYKRFIVCAEVRFVTVTDGDPVALKTGLTEMQTDDEIQWMFGDKKSPIAEIKGATVKIYDVTDERFRNRLKLNEKTGDLIINNSTPEHAGYYKLKICSSRGEKKMTYCVAVRVRFVTVTDGDPVALKTGLTEMQTDDEIQWMFGDKKSPIAKTKGGTVKTYDVTDERFRDGLKLNEKTGDLIINNFTHEHAGYYKLKICSSRGETKMTYCVAVRDSTEQRGNESATVVMPLLNGEDVDEVNEVDYVNVMNEEEGTSSL